MKNAVKMNVLLALAVMGAGIVVSGLQVGSAADAGPGAGNDSGKVRRYPGSRRQHHCRTTTEWCRAQQPNFGIGPRFIPTSTGQTLPLTPEGKKVVKLTGGGDVIKWRPDSPTDNKYSIVLVTVAANHLKARDIKDIQDVGKTKTVTFTEGVDLTGVPDLLVNIAHNPGNQLSTTRQADFTLDGDAWKLQSIE